jgi:hypothetical protein
MGKNTIANESGNAAQKEKRLELEGCGLTAAVSVTRDPKQMFPQRTDALSRRERVTPSESKIAYQRLRDGSELGLCAEKLL